MEKKMERQEFFKLVEEEVERAYRKHGRDKWGRHEYYAIMKEEIDEVWDSIKADQPIDELIKEIIQVAAMCVRYLDNLC
jgi:hypothetical protein